ncbi:MAG: helix-turn-helix domain-containing protein [Bacteroidota bacterium]
MNHFPPQINQLPMYQQVWITQLVAYIQEAKGKSELSVCQLAARFQMSERQFYRRVRQNFSISPKQLVQQIKMYQAKEMLERGTHATVAEVAYDLGYNHPESFSNVFCKTFGQRPSSILKNNI